jgi:energy-converting hydrogenase Eha subunit F
MYQILRKCNTVIYVYAFCIWILLLIGLYGPNGLTPAHNAMPKLSAGKFMTSLLWMP